MDIDPYEKPVYYGKCNNCGYEVIGTKPKKCKGCGLKVVDTDNTNSDITTSGDVD